MLRTIKQGGWLIEVNKEETAELYQKMTLLSEECFCTYCLNFVTAYTHFPPTVKEFFTQFGIDPRREGEVYHLDDKEDTILYGGFIHFVGHLIEADPDHPLEIGPDFEASFNIRNDLLPKVWAGPAVQLEFSFQNVPWEFDLTPDELYKKRHPANSRSTRS